MEKYSDHFKSWLSGFIDGEGCFMITPSKKSRAFAIRFALEIRADDLSIIKKIQRYLGGSYYIYDYARENSCDRCPVVTYRLSGAKNCLRLVKHLEKYPLQARKKRDFETWREAIYLIVYKEHLKGKRNYLLYLCDKIRKVRQYEKVKIPQFIDRQLEIFSSKRG